MNLNQFLNTIQAEKYATQPLAAHAVAGLDEHVREHYALLIAAVLRMRPAVSAAQGRVFAMLLESMNLAGRQAALFERAQALTAADLGECHRLLAEHQLTASFFLDVFVLLRLDAPLTDDDLRLCAELADVLRQNSEDLTALVALALHILGVQRLKALPEGIESLTGYHWLEFICEEATAAQLQAGLPPGLWRITRVIEMTTGWTLADVTLFFDDGARLDTYTGSAPAEVVISGCSLVKPALRFSGEVLTFTMRDSRVAGRYPEAARITALSFDNIQEASADRVFFNTVNARAIHAISTPIKLADCLFEQCGHPDLVGGALALRTEKNGRKTRVTLTDCRFLRCTARFGGALRIDCLHYERISISGCLFDQCGSTEPNLDYALYADSIVTAGNERFIQQCQFKRGGFYLGDRTLRSNEGGIYDDVFSGLTLIDASLHAKMRHDQKFRDGIVTIENSAIRTDISWQQPLPAWADDF